MDVLACGCVACGLAMRVDENKCKGKERKKKTYLVGCERVDALACGHGLDADDCEDKKRKKKRKNLLDADPAHGWQWMQMSWNADEH